MKINSKKIIIPVIFLLILVLLISGAVYFYSAKNSLPEKQEGKLDQNVKHCLADDEIASYLLSKEHHPDAKVPQSPIVIQVTNKDTGKEKSSFQIDDTESIHHHSVELHRCWVYVMRTFNYDPKKSEQNPGYRKELWKYDYNGNGEAIILLAEKPKEFISYYSYDFRVDPFEKYIVLAKGYFGEDDYTLVIKNIEAKEDVFVLPIKEITDKYPDVVGSIRLNDWSDDGRYFWFDLHIGAIRLGFVHVDTITWKADIFPAPENTMGGDALNFDTGYVTSHPNYIYFGVYELEQEEKEKRRKEGVGQEIYVESLITKERHFVDKTDEPLWFFKPKWISETELEYYLPLGEKRVYEIGEL